ncbi:Twin-arginine translocation pathway signal [Labrys neptuniae]
MKKAGQANELSRRGFIASAAAGVAFVVAGGALYCPREAWALEATTLKPETIETLIRMSRDIYPHDRLPDRYYAIAVKDFDAKAGKDAASKALFEDGVTMLDGLAAAAGGKRYADLGWEEERLAILRQIEASPFFGAVRSGLVVGLYNQKEVWPLFGYEGSSADKGGYIARGFSDIEWL